MDNKNESEILAATADAQESVIGYSPSIDPEELEMLNDPEFMRRFEKAKADIANGACRKFLAYENNSRMGTAHHP